MLKTRVYLQIREKNNKRNRFILFLLLTCFPAFLFPGCHTDNNLLQKVTPLSSYPSASGIEYSNGQIFLIGDDANNLLILDTSLTIRDSIALFHFPGKTIPKPIKADLEAITLTDDHRLLVTGSGSLVPYRQTGWLIDPVSRSIDSFRLDTFYQRIRVHGISELNLEGLTTYPGGFIMANRGSLGYPRNHLIFTRRKFWERQAAVDITTMYAGSNVDSTHFSGISGLCYAPKNDALLLTVSTENTPNSLDDGAIGKSYLWIIRNISSKRNWKAVNPDKIIDLEVNDPRFRGHKIESVCIAKETKSRYYLVLAADNDNGTSTLFNMVVSKD